MTSPGSGRMNGDTSSSADSRYHSPNSTTILAALRHGLKDERNFGGPRAVWIDNGKDYDAWLFHGPWLKFKRAVDAQQWPDAGSQLNRIRQIIAVNLPLGLIVVAIGGTGRFWS